MRILHTESSMVLGGREFAVLGITEGLLKRGHHALLIVQPHSAIQKLAQERNLPCETVSMSKIGYPRAIREFLRWITKYGIDIIHTHSSRDRWIATIATYLSSRPPAVVIGRHHCGAIRDSLVNRLLYKRLSRCIVTTGGERLRQELIQKNRLAASQVVSIPSGVDLGRFTPRLDGSEVRDEFKIQQDALLVGTVCFLRNYKGLDHFIEAARIVLAQAPRTRFVIVGVGPEEERLRAQIQQADLSEQILMTGHRHDVPKVLATMDLCVVTSTGTDTLTQVIPQAFAMEKPVVATNVGGISDIVRHDVTGHLVPPANSPAIAENILWFIHNRARGRQLAQVERRLVMECYSTESTLDRTEQLYRQLVQTSPVTT